MAIGAKFEKKERQAEENSGIQRGVEGPSLKEILADKTKSDLFGEYLSQEGDGDLAEKIISGDLTDDELRILAWKRDRFVEICDRSEKIAEFMDGDMVEAVVESSPDLKVIAKLNGPDGIREAITRYLPRIAITSREQFIALERAIAPMEQSKKARAEHEKEMQKFRKELKISEDAFVELLQGGDAKEVAKDLRDDLNWVKKLFTRTSSIQDKIESRAGTHSWELRAYLEENERDKKRFGGILSKTLLNNPLLKETLVADLRKEELPEKESGMSFADIEEPSEEDIKKGWEEFRKSYKEKWGTTPEYSDNLYDREAMKEFSEDYMSKTAGSPKGKKGFWASISEDFWTSMIRDTIKNG